MTPAKRRYDAKRKGTDERLAKERARGYIRRARARGRLQSLGGCILCKATGVRTVWHHPDYRRPWIVQEVCFKCHRALHPRPIPGA